MRYPGSTYSQETPLRFASLSTAFALILVAGFAATTPVMAAGEYTVTDVGTLLGTGDGRFDVLGNAQATAINNDGVVVANAYSADPSTVWAVPFTSTDGKVKRFGRERAYSYAFDINDDGDVAGYVTSREDAQFVNLRAAVWRDGHAEHLPSLGGEKSQANGLNNVGDIVGSSTLTPGNGAVHAVLWRNGEAIDLGTLGGDYSFGHKVNDAGVVVGLSHLAGNDVQAPFIWQDGMLSALPVMEGMNGAAHGITEEGVVYGSNFQSAEGATTFRAVRWVNRELEALPALVEDGQGVAFTGNARGQAIGWSSRSDEGMADAGAALWEGDEVVDLNTLIPEDAGYRLTTAVAINDAGQIVAAASSETDAFAHGVVLNPVDDSAARIGTVGYSLPAANLRDLYPDDAGPHLFPAFARMENAIP
jgi:probable HAF family extracellular repeat protein